MEVRAQATRAMTDMHEAGVCPERDFVIDSEYVKCASSTQQWLTCTYLSCLDTMLYLL